MKILVTGAAGFIGFHVVKKLLDRGDEVVGLDNLNDYYDPRLKYARLEQCGIRASLAGKGILQSSEQSGHYQFIKLHLEQKEDLNRLFAGEHFDVVCNLAAQAGVRHSLTHPDVYVQSNITGFLNILEACRYYPVKHLVYASSSSVYGLNSRMPFSVHQPVDHPVSLYAASKKANEMMAHTYSHLFNIPSTGLRFFTVYGPWGRPDMALFLFTEAILNSRPIELFNEGNMERDFTYIDDIVEGVVRVIDRPPSGNKDWPSDHPDPATSIAPYRIYNIGNSQPVKLMDFLNALEKELGKKADIRLAPMQPGDVARTWADVSDLEKDTGYKPSTPVSVGVQRFVEWYRQYYNK